MQFFPPNVHLLQTKKCKKGFKCPQRHTDNDQNDDNLPYMSIAAAKDGKLVCTLRPPLDESWNFICEEKGVPRRALTGSVKITDGNNALRMYQLGFMSAPSPAAKQAMLSNGIHMWSWDNIKNEWKKTWHGAAQRINLQGLFSSMVQVCLMQLISS